MTERERWIVYPLLFLALGAALRDKMIDRTTTKSIVCQELVVIGEQPLGQDPVLLARLGRNDQADSDGPPTGQLLLNGQLLVNGPINAAFYAYQGQPIIPVLRGVLPGASLPAELLQAIPKALTAPANAPQTASPANASGAPPSKAPPSESTAPVSADDASEETSNASPPNDSEQPPTTESATE